MKAMSFVISVVFGSSLGCAKPGCGGSSLPPPVVQGRCVVDAYRDDEIQRRTCVHQGYEWSCANDGGYVVCTRGKEASGERVAP